MQERDLGLLWKFTLRIGMFTGKANRDTISAFLTGYEIGRANECEFTQALLQLIEEEYGIEGLALGWRGQIDQLATKMEIDWVAAFKRQSFKLLMRELDASSKKELANALRRRIEGKLTSANQRMRKDWIADWFGIVDLQAKWFTAIFLAEEVKLMSEVEEELRRIDIQLLEPVFESSEKLQDACARLSAQMAMDNS